MDELELQAWLRLSEVPGLGPVGARRLLAEAGGARAVFELPRSHWRGILAESEIQALHTLQPGWDERVQAVRAWLGDRADRAVLTLGDEHYPRALLDTADPPLMLYAQGRLPCLNHRALAVVGSRHPTAQGLQTARDFAAALAQAGWVVVSGLAHGIDGAAHEGALSASGGAGTIAVVGTGLDRVYPAAHRELAHRIVAQGVMLSEYPLGTPPLAANFPKRNRLIAGLAQGTLVVEAAVQSGSLITARLAADLGREVFAIPGSIHSPQSRGCHALLKQGAKLVETAQDILEELRHVAQPAATAAPRVEVVPATAGPAGLAEAKPTDARRPGSGRPEGGRRDPVLEAMGFDPVGLDALALRTGWPLPELNAHLLDLELEGRVARLPGQLFQRVERA
jgi:DNA processing protein